MINVSYLEGKKVVICNECLKELKIYNNKFPDKNVFGLYTTFYRHSRTGPYCKYQNRIFRHESSREN